MRTDGQGKGEREAPLVRRKHKGDGGIEVRAGRLPRAAPTAMIRGGSHGCGETATVGGAGGWSRP